MKVDICDATNFNTLSSPRVLCGMLQPSSSSSMKILILEIVENSSKMFCLGVKITNEKFISPVGEDGATQLPDNSSFIQGISQKGMEIVGDFFEDFRQMGRTIPEKEASTKEHKSTPRKKGEDENYVDNGGATPSFVGEGEDYNLGGAGEERPEKE
ncbi:uncharacterized protein LOC103492138 isoform X2 [Cucumis melo]|uniref:Uncharacterized protein LOC103492138 isoform X2 n=1 Tax=Cucumis melo TaxID=3656 RepID=A0ABM3KHD9_CUCME|nr:uncharacterized protein LOC103492138 isoform X2 [Cucumis melo]